MNYENYDIVIVGSGAAGSAALWNLSSIKGLKILCIEQGSKIKKNEYIHNDYKLDLKKLTEFNHISKYRKSIYDYPIDDENSDISVSNFNAVGGSTILYSGHCPRFHPSDFKVKTLDRVGYDWPINYEDLEKFYKINEKNIKLRGKYGDPAYPKIKKLLKPIKIRKSGEVMANAFNKLNWHWWPSYSSANENEGIHKGKRITSVESYIDRIKNKRIKLKTECSVTKIILKDKNNFEGLIYRDNKKKDKFVKCSIILLAASAIGTPRILLNSKNKFYKNGLANSSDQIGKNLMLHPLVLVQGQFKQYLGSQIGPDGCCIYSHEFYETKKNQNFKRGYTIQVLRGMSPLNSALYLSKLNRLNLGENFHAQFVNFFGRHIPIAVICEDLPNSKNYLEIDKYKKDNFGMPGVKLNYKVSNNSKEMMKHGIKNVTKLLKTAGAYKIDAYGPVRNTGWHISGTARMGTNKYNSVVDKFGQTHDIKNLFIIDSSIFPTSSAVNIASTIQALSLMITSNIKKTLENI